MFDGWGWVKVIILCLSGYGVYSGGSSKLLRDFLINFVTSVLYTCVRVCLCAYISTNFPVAI